MIIDDLMTAFGLTRDEAQTAVRTVVEGAQAALPRAPRGELRAASGLAGPWRGARRPSTVRGIQALVGHRLGVPPTRAAELTAAVSAALARRLTFECRVRLHQELPTDLAALFDQAPTATAAAPPGAWG